MAIFNPSFKDITIDKEYMKAKVRLSVFGGRFKEAQIWLDQQIMLKMTPFIPKKTGEFLGKIQAENASKVGTGKVVTSVPPQGLTLYPGVSKSGNPFQWTNPQTQPYWGKYTVQTFRREFNEGVERILKRKGGGSGG